MTTTADDPLHVLSPVQLSEMRQALLESSNIVELGNLFRATLESLDIQAWLVVRDDGRLLLPSPWTNIPQDIINKFKLKNWIQDDVAAGQALLRRHPILWHELVVHPGIVRNTENVQDSLQTVGFTHGLTIPISGASPGSDIMSVLLSPEMALNAVFVNDICSICQMVWWRVLKLEFLEMDNSTTLTPREYQVLTWMKQGKSHRDIGTILGLSQRAIEFHAGNILRKLEAGDKLTAVLTALRKRIIHL